MFSPYWTHPLTALLRFAIAALIAHALITASLSPLHAALIIAAAYVSGYYEGREAGQREHDLKHATPPWKEVTAWLGAEYWFGWSLANLAQALAGIVPVIIVAVLLMLFMS